MKDTILSRTTIIMILCVVEFLSSCNCTGASLWHNYTLDRDKFINFLYYKTKICRPDKSGGFWRAFELYSLDRTWWSCRFVQFLTDKYCTSEEKTTRNATLRNTVDQAVNGIETTDTNNPTLWAVWAATDCEFWHDKCKWITIALIDRKDRHCTAPNIC